MALTTENVFVCPECQGVIHNEVCHSCGLTTGERVIGDSYICLHNDKTGSHGNWTPHYGVPANVFTRQCGRTFPLKTKNLPLRLVRARYREITNESNREKYGKVLRLWNSALRLNYVCVDQIMRSFQKICKNGPVHNKMSVLATCVYQTVKLHKIPLRFKEVVECIVGKDTRFNARMHMFNCRTYDLKNVPGSSAAFLDRFISNLFTSKAMQQLRNIGINPNDVYEEIRNGCLPITTAPRKSGGNPVNFVAGVVYCVSKVIARKYAFPRFISMEKMAKACNCNTWALRDAWVFSIRPKWSNYLEGLFWK